MSEWYCSQKKPNSDVRKLLQERIEKANPRCKLSAEDQKRFAKLESIAVKLKRGEHEHNRQLQPWLSKDEYAQIEAEWEEQLELRETLKDKQGELQRCKEKLRQASYVLLHRADGYSSKGKRGQL